MHDSKLTKLFDRYRAKSDLGALAEVFDLVSPELLRVARHVAGRGVDPEDLVQATFLAAIERAVTFDSERPLVPWLLGILINQSRLTKRHRSLALPDEVAASIAAVEPALDGAESHEIDEAVTRALGTLPEMYREVLLPHISDGKKPHEIARDLGRPQGTVRAQIHRGIRLMRKALPTGFALGAFGVLRPNALASVREEVLREAARQTGQGPGAIVTADALRVSRIWRRRMFTGAAGAVVLGALWFAWPAHADRGSIDVDLAANASNVRANEDIASPTTPTRARTSTFADSSSIDVRSLASADPYGSLLVHVVHAISNAPAEGVRVTVIPWGDPYWFESLTEARTNANGDAVFERLHDGRVGVHVDNGVQSRFDVSAGERTRAVAVIAKGIAVHARIVDTRGNAVSGAVLETYADRDEAPRSCAASSDSRGVVDLADVDPHFWIAARAPGHAPSRLVWLGNPTRVNDTAPISIELVVLESPFAFEGVIENEDGVPIADASVRIETQHAPDPLWKSDGAIEFERPATIVKSDPRGKFRAEIERSHALDVHVEALGFAAFSTHFDTDYIFAPVQLHRAAHVHGVVHFSDGSVAPSTAIAIDASESTPRLVTQSDVRGEFDLDDVAPGRHTIRARAGGIGPEVVANVVVTTGAPFEWNGVVEHQQTIEGRAIGEDGRPVKTWLVLAVPETETTTSEEPGFLGSWARRSVPPDTDSALLQCWSTADGHFTVPCKSGSTHRLELRARGSWRGPVQAVATGVEAGARGVVLRVKRMHSGFEGNCVDPAGNALGPATLIASSVGISTDATAPVDAASGHFDITLVPGAYDLVVWPRDGLPRHLGRHVLSVGEQLSLGKCVIAAGGVLELRDERPSGDAPELWSAGGLRTEVVRSAADSWRATALPPGKYRVVVRSETRTPVVYDVAIESNETARLTLPR